MLGPQTLRHANMVRMSVGQDDRIHQVWTSADLMQRVSDRRVVLGPRGIDERHRVAVAQQTPVGTRSNDQEYAGRRLGNFNRQHPPPGSGLSCQPYASARSCQRRTRDRTLDVAASLAVSLDGHVAKPDGSVGFLDTGTVRRDENGSSPTALVRRSFQIA